MSAIPSGPFGSPEAEISARINAAMEDVGGDLWLVICNEIRVKWPPSSQPGEYPRQRPPHKDGSPNLIDSINWTVESDGTLIMSADKSYAIYLRALRDFFGDQAVERYLPLVVAKLQEAFQP